MRGAVEPRATEGTMSARHSFEFFPTKTDAGQVKLIETARELARTGPEFFSVTYGAGGSTRERTFGAVKEIHGTVGVPTAPHLSCVGSTKDEIREILREYKDAGIRRIVALRGDLPSGMGPSIGELKHAVDLVRLIREEHGDHFVIEVAAYPEMHPQARSFDADLEHFVEKMKAGADAAITQYFFNADAYFHFVERVRKLGVEAPIVPGIMPITNFGRLARFSDACGAEIPRYIRKQLEVYGEDDEAVSRFGEDVMTRVCEKLLRGGAPSIHFYTLNAAAPSLAIGRNLGLWS